MGETKNFFLGFTHSPSYVYNNLLRFYYNSLDSSGYSAIQKFSKNRYKKKREIVNTFVFFVTLRDSCRFFGFIEILTYSCFS